MKQSITKTEKRERQKGQAVVEFALVVTLFLFVLMGIFEFGRMVYTKHLLDKATREAARTAATEIDTQTATDKASAVCHNILSSVSSSLSQQTTCTAAPVKVEGIDALTVTASYTFHSIITQGKLAIAPNLVLTSATTMRKEG